MNEDRLEKIKDAIEEFARDGGQLDFINQRRTGASVWFFDYHQGKLCSVKLDTDRGDEAERRVFSKEDVINWFENVYKPNISTKEIYYEELLAVLRGKTDYSLTLKEDNDYTLLQKLLIANCHNIPQTALEELYKNGNIDVKLEASDNVSFEYDFLRWEVAKHNNILDRIIMARKFALPVFNIKEKVIRDIFMLDESLWVRCSFATGIEGEKPRMIEKMYLKAKREILNALNKGKFDDFEKLKDVIGLNGLSDYEIKRLLLTDKNVELVEAFVRCPLVPNEISKEVIEKYKYKSLDISQRKKGLDALLLKAKEKNQRNDLVKNKETKKKIERSR